MCYYGFRLSKYTNTRNGKMNTYQKIEAAINNIKNIHQEAGNELHQQLFHAGNSGWSREDLSEYVKSDNDVVDHFGCENILDEIREIQDSIINFFGE